MRLTFTHKTLYVILFTGLILGSCSPELSDAYLTQEYHNRDGRFSIGADNQNLTYSWFTDSATWATSQFVVMVDGAYASNYPLTDTSSNEKLTAYLRGTNRVYRKGSHNLSETAYRFRGIDITQKLTPVKKNLQELERRNNYAQYYKITYELRNTTDSSVSVGFRLLLDTQLKTSDDCIIEPLTAKGLKKLLGLFRKDPELNNASQTFRKSSMPKRILVHETKERDVQNLIAALRPCIKDLEHPDELVIGDWNEMTSDVWSVRNLPKYGDSGISMRWFRKTLAPGDTNEYTVFYGLHLPKWGRRVFRKERKPNESLMLKFQGSTDYLMDTYLTANKDTVEIGDSVFVSWNIHHNECYPDSLTDLVANVDSIKLYHGMFGLRPMQDTAYWMSLRVEKSKVRAFWQDSVYVKYTPGKDNGRFTMGADGEDLLFGYPFNLSTSHIILSVFDAEEAQANENNVALSTSYDYFQDKPRFYTNATEVVKGESIEKLKKEQRIFKPKLFTGKLDTLQETGSGNYKISYPAEDTSMYLIQRLIAYNQNFEPVAEGEVGQYFQLQYDIGNASANPKAVGLGLVLDTRVSGAERGWMLVDSVDHWIQKDTTLQPEEFYVFHDDPDTLRMMHGVLGMNGATPPNKVYNTLWQSIRSEVLGSETSLDIPNDRAIFSQWSPALIPAKSWKRYSIFLGNPKADSVKVKFHKEPYASLKLLYDFDKDSLIAGEVEALKKFYKGAMAPRKNKDGELYIPYSHVVIEGFTGSLGSSGYNFNLANRRIAHIRKLLGNLKVDQNVVLDKIDGEYYAQDGLIRQDVRNHERMVWIKVY